MRGRVASWIEAMRLRTLPVSLAGVAYAAGLGVVTDHFALTPLILCLLFALLAQIASNFANEYYDFKAGLDRAGREGPRRGVTEGDITPGAMKAATFITLGAACFTGVTLVALYGQWWMYLVGILTALGVMAYSTGPFPLSHNGLGEVAVVIFFGVVPVCLTYILMGGTWSGWLVASAIGIGLLGANVLVVNNYRDREDDKAVGKHTLAVMVGLPAMASLYVADGFMAVILTLPAWMATMRLAWIAPCAYLVIHLLLYHKLITLKGHKLNPVLGQTAVLMLAFALTFLILAIISTPQ